MSSINPGIRQRHHTKISIIQSGSPYDNAIAERINGILKIELGLDQIFSSLANAEEIVHLAIGKYNLQRPHFSCELKTPQYKHNYSANKDSVKRF